MEGEEEEASLKREKERQEAEKNRPNKKSKLNKNKLSCFGFDDADEKEEDAEISPASKLQQPGLNDMQVLPTDRQRAMPDPSKVWMCII